MIGFGYGYVNNSSGGRDTTRGIIAAGVSIDMTIFFNNLNIGAGIAVPPMPDGFSMQGLYNNRSPHIGPNFCPCSPTPTILELQEYRNTWWRQL